MGYSSTRYCILKSKTQNKREKLVLNKKPENEDETMFGNENHSIKRQVSLTNLKYRLNISRKKETIMDRHKKKNHKLQVSEKENATMKRSITRHRSLYRSKNQTGS